MLWPAMGHIKCNLPQLGADLGFFFFSTGERKCFEHGSKVRIFYSIVIIIIIFKDTRSDSAQHT